MFKKDEFIPIVLSTETGIHEADVISDKKMIDRRVREALEAMVHGLRDGTLPDYDPSVSIRYVAGDETALVSLMIRRNWSQLFETFPHPGKDVLEGILRTLLNSIETFTTPSASSRGYLSFLAGFLREAGVQVQIRTEEGLVQEGEDDPLIEFGEAWLDGDEEARLDFYELASKLVASGKRDRVVNAAQYLVGLAGHTPEMRELSNISITVQQGEKLEVPPPRW